MAALLAKVRDGDIIRVNGQPGESNSAGRRGELTVSLIYSDPPRRVRSGRA